MSIKLLKKSWYDYKSTNEKDIRAAYFAGAGFVIKTLCAVAHDDATDFADIFNSLSREVVEEQKL